MSLVDYTRAELRKAPRKGRPNRREMHVPVMCPGCEQERWLTVSTARKVEQRCLDALDDQQIPICGRCQRRLAGARGYEVTVSKYPNLRWKIMDKVREHRRQNPSSLEQIVASTLDDLGVHYQREAYLATKAHGRRQRIYLLDFVVLSFERAVAIEVDGAYWHADPDQRRRDRAKKALLTRRGYHTLRISEAQIASGQHHQLLQNFLQ